MYKNSSIHKHPTPKYPRAHAGCHEMLHQVCGRGHGAARHHHRPRPRHDVRKVQRGVEQQILQRGEPVGVGEGGDGGEGEVG